MTMESNRKTGRTTNVSLDIVPIMKLTKKKNRSRFLPKVSESCQKVSAKSRNKTTSESQVDDNSMRAEKPPTLNIHRIDERIATLRSSLKKILAAAKVAAHTIE